MEAFLKQKAERLLRGETLIFSNDQLNDLLGYRITNYIRSELNSERLGTKDTWKCWIAVGSLARAVLDNPFSKD